jgi:hypothetical protein
MKDASEHDPLRFVTAAAGRVLKQKELIAQLQKQERSTVEAEAVLKKLEASLRQIENHAGIMHDLTKPNDF